MTDFSKCPSCGVQPEYLKDGGSFQFRHGNTCKIGFVGGKGGECTVCKATMTFQHVDIQRPGAWKSPHDCPICWATVEANLGIKP